MGYVFCYVLLEAIRSAGVEIVLIIHLFTHCRNRRYFNLVESIKKAFKWEEQMSNIKLVVSWALSVINIDYSSLMLELRNNCPFSLPHGSVKLGPRVCWWTTCERWIVFGAGAQGWVLISTPNRISGAAISLHFPALLFERLFTCRNCVYWIKERLPNRSRMLECVSISFVNNRQCHLWQELSSMKK